MNILFLNGSPRKNGNTATFVSTIEKELESSGHNVENIFVDKKIINGCKGCYACKKKNDVFGCPQKDDVGSIFESMYAADAIIYAVPLYCWCFPAQMKLLIDRQISLVKDFETPKHKSLIEDKKLGLIVTCEGPVEENADTIQIVFERFCEYLKVNYIGSYVLHSCTTPDKLPEDSSKLMKSVIKAIL